MTRVAPLPGLLEGRTTMTLRVMKHYRRYDVTLPVLLTAVLLAIGTAGAASAGVAESLEKGLRQPQAGSTTVSALFFSIEEGIDAARSPTLASCIGEKRLHDDPGSPALVLLSDCPQPDCGESWNGNLDADWCCRKDQTPQNCTADTVCGDDPGPLKDW